MRKTIKTFTLAFSLLLPVFAGGSSSAQEKQETFDELLARIEETRLGFAQRWKNADVEEKRQIREEARRFIVDVVAEDIVPMWKGVPWTMAVIDDGLKPNAERPGQKGRGISCSWFVVRVLQNAAVRFVSDKAFAGTIAIHFQKALSPRKKDIKRYWSITPAQLEKRFVGLGDGLYVIGLNCHIGLVHVKGEKVRFLHSSYVEPYQVVVEDLVESEAIALSEDAGYVVSPLFKGIRLIDSWITGTKIPFRKPSR